MVGFIVGNSEPDRPILLSAAQPSSSAADKAASGSRQSSGASVWELIPGLPNDTAKKCLARVPFWSHARCKAVCRFWRALFSDAEIIAQRRQEGCTEEFLVCFDGDPTVCQGQLHNPQTGQWRKLPPTPVALHTYGLKNYGVAVLGHHIYILGGVLFDARSYPTDHPVPSTQTHRLDIVTNQWQPVAAMTEARGSLACAADGAARKIYVAGGDGSYTQSNRRWSQLASAEVYDVGSDAWEPIPRMTSFRSSPSALYLDGRFFVLGGFGAPHLVGGFILMCEECIDSEVYDVSAMKWTKKPIQCFPEERTATGPVVLLHGAVFMLLGSTLLRLNQRLNVWCHETSLEWSDHDATFFALNGEIHVVPSEKVSSIHQKHYSYNPVTGTWKTSRLRPRLRYLRMNQASRQPFKNVSLVTV